jgi:gliding motility-associated-like protein
MVMNDLKNIVENMTELPSDNCWAMLEQQLEAVIPNSPSGSEGVANTAASNSTTMLQSAAAAGFSKGAVALITVGAIAAVTTVASIAWTISRPDKTIQSKTNYSNSESELIQDSVYQDIEEKEEKTIVEKTPSIQDFLVSTTSFQNTENENLSTFSTSVSTHSAPTSPVIISSPLTPNAPTQSQANITSSSQISQPEENLPMAQAEPVISQPAISQESIVASEPVASEELAIELTIPNIFTPNGDGFNDQFVIENIEYCSESRLTIRNSRGNVVFDKLNYQNDWTADSHPDGIYYYTFTYILNGETQRVKGNITIKRGY